MRIAVIGAGVSGSLVARLLATRHEVTLFEAAQHLGGHAQTVAVNLGDQTVNADVGFMVFNRRTYPNFCRMLDLLGVHSQPSDMSFSVRCASTGLEYQGGSLSGLFAQRANLLRPSFLRMLGDILKFNRRSLQAARENSVGEGISVDGFLRECRVGERFISHYLVPMAAAIWSTKPERILEFPAKFLIGFFANHGLLQIRDRPQWRTILGGSKQYVQALLGPMRNCVRLGQSVVAIRRLAEGVELQFKEGNTESFDEVVLATHADDSLRMLADAHPDEREILTAFPYQQNEAVLHTDHFLLPTRRRAWASWNYHLPAANQEPVVSLTYDLSRLQSLKTQTSLLLTLNHSSQIAPSKVLRTFSFRHPAYTEDSIAAQKRWKEISGTRRTHFCGAYWGYGFHEDGVNSALAVAAHFGIELDACIAACTKGPSPITAAGQ